MIRTPLRPLATILQARQAGEDPREIEKENIRQRHEAMKGAARQRAEGRLLLLGVMFVAAFGVIGLRMGTLAHSEVVEPRSSVGATKIVAQRADIVDRNGRILATNIETHSLYAQPPQMIDKERVAQELVRIFPDLNEQRLLKDFTGKRKFLWVRKTLSPEQMQAVHDIGDPGLMFGPREMRLYPNGKLAAHVLGGASFGREGVNAAEVIGVAGVERTFDDVLRDPANGGKALTLSVDLTIQAAMERVLYGGMKLLNAKGAAAVLMDAHTGEVIALSSLPDFDPNDRPRPVPTADGAASPLFNRAVQGVYELGSTFKIFATAQAMELGLVGPDTMINTRGPMKVHGYSIGEFENKNYGEISVTDVIAKSSNRGTGRIALEIGAEKQQEFLGSLGFFEPTPLEIVEATGGKPLRPSKWTDLSAVTISYGHGLSATPLHLASAYAALANGGHAVRPTILKQEGANYGPRVMSAEVAAASVMMLRKVVTDGTASMGEVPGYFVAGKTGTADKPKPTGGYYEDKVINTFASVFPAHDPKYVLVVTLDEPVETMGEEPRRTAGWTAVPVASEIIGRVAPLLGLLPHVEPVELTDITLAAN